MTRIHTCKQIFKKLGGSKKERRKEREGGREYMRKRDEKERRREGVGARVGVRERERERGR